MKLQQRYSNFESTEGFVGESDLLAGGEEYNAFVLLMCFQE
jgi:hypothetical protein